MVERDYREVLRGAGAVKLPEVNTLSAHCQLLAIDDDLAYLSRSSVASYRLPRIPRVFAKRSLNVSAPGVSPLVPRSVSK